MKFVMIVRSWKSSLSGLAGILVGVVASYHNPNIHSIMDMLKDPVFQIALVVGILGGVSKDANISGPPAPSVQASVVPADGPGPQLPPPPRPAPPPPRPPPQEAIDRYNATASEKKLGA